MTNLRTRLTAIESRSEPAPAGPRQNLTPEAVAERVRLLVAGQLPRAEIATGGRDTNMARLIRERCEELGAIDANA